MLDFVCYVEFKKLYPDAEAPSFATQGSSGADLKAYFPKEWTDRELTIPPGRVMLIKTGLAMAIPVGYEGQVRSRSGLALKHQISVLNSPGTVDSDYRGEVGVILFNHGNESYKVRHGDKIAQIVFTKVPGSIVLLEKDELSQTARGEGGFGSTGS